MKDRMVLSNEPGYYQPGSFGIRIENVMISKQSSTSSYASQFSHERKWIDFETITLVPLQHKLIDKTVVSESTIEWVNNYHKDCLNILSPYLSREADRDALEWLNNHSTPL